jgi:hypothetical protein
MSKAEQIRPEEIEQERFVGLFLATQNSIRYKLVESLKEVDGYVEVLIEVVNECAALLESGQHALPDEKHRLLMVRASVLALSLVFMAVPGCLSFPDASSSPHLTPVDDFILAVSHGLQRRQRWHRKKQARQRQPFRCSSQGASQSDSARSQTPSTSCDMP